MSIPLSLLLLILSCSIAGAQSGRRAPKPLSPTSPTQPPKEPEPQQPAAQARPAVKEQTLIVGMDGASWSLNIPLYMSDAVMSGFIERFRGLATIGINTVKNMNRKDANNRAKKETESFVVLLELGTDDMSGASLGRVNPDDLIVSYTIFSPVTGKIKDQGRVYVRSYRGVLGGRIPTGRTGDVQLNGAGRETASRVISALHLGGLTIPR
ncbi:MAG TPA: hypothetical protein VF553_00440 [Pyrinomonadaceae bacterium]